MNLKLCHGFVVNLKRLKRVRDMDGMCRKLTLREKKNRRNLLFSHTSDLRLTFLHICTLHITNENITSSFRRRSSLVTQFAQLCKYLTQSINIGVKLSRDNDARHD